MNEVFEFLAELAEHNNRDWMQANKPFYERAKSTFKGLITELLAGINAFDASVEGLEPKDCIFRINRDIRFSKDKNPYKTNFGAAMMEGGKKTGNPTYYIHLQPGKSFVAGGVYMPEAESLKKIRQEIDYNPEELKKIVEADSFKQAFGKITGESLKTAPKGYPKDHPNIELLRMKSFLVVHDLTDAEVLSGGFVAEALDYFKIIHPFNEYLSVAIS